MRLALAQIDTVVGDINGNEKKIRTALADAGFVARGLEFFDEGGSFNQIPWSVEDGLVRRSAEHDTRNVDGRLAYTSLIVDAMPAAGA